MGAIRVVNGNEEMEEFNLFCVHSSGITFILFGAFLLTVG